MTHEQLIAEARAAHCSSQGEEETDPDDGVCPDCWEDAPCLTIRLADALERAESVGSAARGWHGHSVRTRPGNCGLCAALREYDEGGNE